MPAFGRQGGASACGGGDTRPAYMYALAQGGLVTDEEYPYTSGAHQQVGGRGPSSHSDTALYIAFVLFHTLYAASEWLYGPRLQVGACCAGADYSCTNRSIHIDGYELVPPFDEAALAAAVAAQPVAVNINASHELLKFYSYGAFGHGRSSYSDAA